MSENYQNQEVCLYKEWMKLQEQELPQLIQQSSKYYKNNPTNTSNLDAESNSLLDKTIQNFQDYNDGRRRLARDDVSAFLTPTWCTTFENSMSWVGGCRPSTYFSLIYSLCGTDIDSRLSKFLKEGCNDFPQLSSSQLRSIDNLQGRTIKEEDKLSSKMASLQQKLTDEPVAQMAQNHGPKRKLNLEVRTAIGATERAMVSTMEEADKLRLDTVKEIVEILKPSQALDYIIAAKKLRLCVQEWGLEKDRERGRD